MSKRDDELTIVEIIAVFSLLIGAVLFVTVCSIIAYKIFGLLGLGLFLSLILLLIGFILITTTEI